MDPLSITKWGMDPAKIPPPMQDSIEPIIRFFGYHDAHPVALMMTLMEKFGTDWFEWESPALRSEIVTTFKTTNVSEHNWQKIQAIRVLTTTQGFWLEWHIFEKIIQALNNNIPRFDICQRASLAQLMAGMDIANTIRTEQYGEEIPRYIAACAIDEGVQYLPPPLDFAQNMLAEPKYRCNVCGDVDLDDMDGRCDYCTGRFQGEHPLSMKPAKGVPDSAGKDVVRFLTRDPAPVKARFEELLAKGIENVQLNEESPEDVQAAKIMVAYDYMKMRRQQLVAQLEELKAWISHGT